jgi:F-type H+-transporting ATPase subunit delta
MNQTKIARRYATALFNFALEQKQQDKVWEDMVQLQLISSQSYDFIRFIKSPVIKVHKKLEVVHALFANNLSVISIKFMEIIIKGRREMVIPAIADQYVELYNESKGIKEVELTSATALDEHTKSQLIRQLTLQTSKQIKLKEKIQPLLIGGFILKMDNKQFDASIQSKLSKLRNELSEKY